MRTGVYAIKIPSGFLIFNCIHFKVVPKFKFPPAESPVKTLIIQFSSLLNQRDNVKDRFIFVLPTSITFFAVLPSKVFACFNAHA